MKRFVTMVCSATFMVAGIMIAKSTANIRTATQSIHAATVQQQAYSKPLEITDLPLDLRLDLMKHDTVFITDTIYPTFLSNDVVIEGRYKKKKVISPVQHHKKSVEPDTIPTPIQKDTLYVPSVYIIVPLEQLDSAKNIIKPMFENLFRYGEKRESTLSSRITLVSIIIKGLISLDTKNSQCRFESYISHKHNNLIYSGSLTVQRLKR